MLAVPFVSPCTWLRASSQFVVFGGRRGNLAASNELTVYMPEDNAYEFMEADNGTFGLPPARSSHCPMPDICSTFAASERQSINEKATKT